MKKCFLATGLLLTICGLASNAATFTDSLADVSLWSDSSVSPQYVGIPGDPLGPDDGWMVQDNAGGGWWSYKTTGWNKITSLGISQTFFAGYPDSFSGYDLAGNALSGAVEIIKPGSTGVEWDNWKTISYSDLSTLNLRGLKILGDSFSWSLLAGTVQFETADMVGHLLSADTVDGMQDTSMWFDADTTTQDWARNPGNIKTDYTGILGNPIGPDDGYDAGGLWAGECWVSYKTAPGKAFGQVSMSFAACGAKSGLANLQYWNGNYWVDAIASASTGTLGSSWEWFTRSYDFTALNTNQIKVSGNFWTPRIGTMDMKVVSAPGSVSGHIVLADYNMAGDAVRRLAVPVVIEFIKNGNVVNTQRVDLAEDGSYTTSPVADGAYDLTFTAGGFLRKIVSGVVLAGPETTNLASITLTNGDVDGDNEVTSTDLSILGLNLGLTGD